jgi:hypothetical protein
MQSRLDEESKKLEVLKAQHRDYVERNQIKLETIGKRERFFDKVEELVHDTDALLAPADKVRVLNHVMQDIKTKDPIRENTPV